MDSLEGLELKKALFTAALAVLRCPMSPVDKDQALSNALELLDNGEDVDFPETGLQPFDKAVSDYLEGNTQPITQEQNSEN